MIGCIFIEGHMLRKEERTCFFHERIYDFCSPVRKMYCEVCKEKEISKRRYISLFAIDHILSVNKLLGTGT